MGGRAGGRVHATAGAAAALLTLRRCPRGARSGAPAWLACRGAAMAHLATARGNNDHAQPANPAPVGSQHIAADPRYAPDEHHQRLMKSRG
jgi:hypothetical protein